MWRSGGEDTEVSNKLMSNELLIPELSSAGGMSSSTSRPWLTESSIGESRLPDISEMPNREQGGNFNW